MGSEQGMKPRTTRPPTRVSGEQAWRDQRRAYWLARSKEAYAAKLRRAEPAAAPGERWRKVAVQMAAAVAAKTARGRA